MNKFTQSLLSVALFAALIGGVAQAATVTNRGEVITVNLMSENTGGGSTTVEKDQSVWPNMGVNRFGNYVIHGKIPDGEIWAAGIHDLVIPAGIPDGWSIPKGTILLEDAVIEVTTAISPTSTTNQIAVGGVDILASSATALASTGIKAAVASAAETLTNDVVYINLGAASSNLEFMIYLPIVLGNGQ